MSSREVPIRIRLFVAILLGATAAAMAACGSDPPTGPSGPDITITPDTGRWGQRIVIEGDAVTANATVRFTAAQSRSVDAFVLERAAGRIEAWVPTDAVTGPVRVVSGTDEPVVADTFTVTAQNDVLAAGTPTDVGFPYINPSLMAGGTPDHLRFSMDQAGPVSLHLADRGDDQGESTLRAWLFRTDTQPATLMGFLLTRESRARTERIDSVVYSRTSLPAGDYALLVSTYDLSGAGSTSLSRPYGVRLESGETWGTAPDGHEANDYPGEATAVTSSFSGSGQMENPFAMDHYTFDVPSAGTLTVATSAVEPGLLLYLIPAGPTDILEAWEDGLVLAEAGGADASQSLQADVAAGTYTALVWDWSGHDRQYNLDVIFSATTSTAGLRGATAGSPATASLPAPVQLPGHRPGVRP